jgi:aminopeptidase N
LVEAGQLDYETALNLTRYLEHETDYIPWESVLTGMEYISSMMSCTSGYGLFKKHMRTILTLLYNQVEFEHKPSLGLALWVTRIASLDPSTPTLNRWPILRIFSKIEL